MVYHGDVIVQKTLQARIIYKVYNNKEHVSYCQHCGVQFKGDAYIVVGNYKTLFEIYPNEQSLLVCCNCAGMLCSWGKIRVNGKIVKDIIKMSSIEPIKFEEEEDVKDD